MNLKQTYDRIAEDWVQDHNQDIWWVGGANRFIALLRPGDTILDVGCGGGIKTNWLLHKGFKSVGIDFSDKMIKIAKRQYPQIPFYVHDILKSLSFHEQFDGIFAQAVLLHISKKNFPLVLASLLGILKPGGYLYVAVKAQRIGEVEEEIVAEDDYGYRYDRFFSYYTATELHQHFLDAGLELVDQFTTDSGQRSWIQIIGRKNTDEKDL